MHITLVLDQYDKQNNGTTITARRLAQTLREAGHTVTILAGGGAEEGKICAKKHSIPFFQKLIESQGMCFAKPDPALYYEAFKEADLVHFFMPFRFCRTGEKHARQMRVPAVSAFHVQPENITSSLFLNRWEGINRWLYRRFNRQFYNRFTHIHAPSRFIADQLAENGYDANVQVISNGVAPVFRPMDTEKPAAWKDKFVILMVGRYSREKRQDVLIKAAGRSKYADRIQLILAGKGPTRGHYARLGKRLPNAPIMEFFTQEDLLQVINQSDLYVHPSDAEIEGISAMEAMACGLVPVISDSKRSATHQYALCPESLFAAGNAEDLAKKIDHWIEHPEERAKYGALHRAQQDNNRVDACVEKMIAFYQDAIQANACRLGKAVTRKRKSFAPHGESLDASLVSACKKGARVRDILPTLVSWILAPINAGLLGLRLEGQENLKGLEKGAVTVCNHVHFMDCTMIKRAFRGKKLWVISLKENFMLPVVGHLIRRLGAVPLEEKLKKQITTTRRLLERLQTGDLVHYFPEGMLVPYSGELRPMHSGAFDMAARANCPVVPMVLRQREGRGLYRLKGKRCFTLCIGTPIYPEGGAGLEAGPQTAASGGGGANGAHALRRHPPDTPGASFVPGHYGGRRSRAKIKAT